MKTVIWTNIPNHYQDSFYKALRAVGVDLKVCYYERIPEERLRMGWNQFKVLPSGEQYVSKSLAFPDLIHDWRERIHVIPGYGDLFIRSLAIHLSQNGVCWIHWSEPSHLGMRWWLTYPIKKWYANLVNRYALGAFGNGIRALQDFRRWGMRQDRLALLPYSAAAGNRSVSPDNMCRDFCSGRSAFLFLGSLCQRKGIDILLTAFSQISRSNPDWVLILAGDDRSNGKYLRLAETMGLTDRILFRGPVPAPAVAAILRQAQVLVLPSHFDGWGVVLNEAASMGLALIASDQVGASYHLIEPAVNGFRVRAGSITSLTNSMSTYTNEPNLAIEHGEQSLRIFNNYTPEHNAERFLNAINSWSSMVKR